MGTGLRRDGGHQWRHTWDVTEQGKNWTYKAKGI